jgi:NDP-sugar pyrophosphorylase family protein
MKAMILAAGQGTRLLPLTRFRPKPLFPIYNVPLLGLTIDFLKRAGVKEIVINTHHLSQSIESYLGKIKPAGVNIQLSHEETLLGTGGAVKKVENFWNDSPFILINGDIIHTIDLTAAYQNHLDRGDLATLIVHDHPPYYRIEMDQEETIVGLREERVKKPVSPTRKLAFTGIHIISPRILEKIPPRCHVDIINLYLELIARGENIGGYPVEGHYWLDIGTPNDYHRIHQDIHNNRKHLRTVCPYNPPKKKADAMGLDASFEGYVSLGGNITLGKNCTIRNSILWDGVTINDNLTVEGCIIGNGVTVERSFKNEIVV